MDNQTKKASGLFNPLTIVLCILLIAAVVLCFVLNTAKNDMSGKVNTLREANVTLAAERDSISEAAEADLLAANQTIASLEESLNAKQTEYDALQGEYSTYQTDADAALAAAVQQGEADVKATQDAADETLAALQAKFDAYKTDADATLAAAVQQGEAEVKAAQAAAAETLAALQAEIASYQAASEDPAADDAMMEDETETVEADEASEAEAPTTEDTVTEETAVEAMESAPPFTDSDVLATVNGASVTGADIMDDYQSIVNYYGAPDAESQDLYYAVAMDQAITLKLIELTAAEMGLDVMTQEETDAIYETSDVEWQNALDNYVSYNIDTTTATEEELAAAYTEAEAYYGDLGFTQESLRESYMENELYGRVEAALCQDVAVTDDDVLAYYNSVVEADQAAYQDADAYEMQLMMVQYGYADQTPWYHPEGYRYVKHILLEADSDLLAAYTDLAAKYNEQTEETPEEDLVTAEDVEAAKAAVIESVQAQIDEINQKLADGESFDDLITEYGTDPGMTSGEYPNGYEVSLSSSGYVPEFVTGTFSVDAIGDVSAPFVSDYGVHLIQYAGDVPAGPIELTDDMKATIYDTLLSERNAAALEAWYTAADIEYTGVLRSVDEINAETAE